VRSLGVRLGRFCGAALTPGPRSPTFCGR
jgi:hypothetical protein